MGAYLRPRDLDTALAALAERRLRVLAGGTDLYPAAATRAAWGEAPDDDILDITGIPGLDGLDEEAAAFRLGPLVTWSRLLEAELPAWFRGLRLAAREIGGVQIQNRGTLAGNLCNASPAADGVPALLSLDAAVELTSLRGSRRLPLAAFVLGNRRTALAADELLTAIVVPKPAHPARATFLKLGARRYLVISIAMVAATIEATGDGTLAAARIAVGACSATAQRLPELERALAGRPLDAALAGLAEPRHLAGLAPIDDPRASADYRREAALTLVRRALGELAHPTLERAA